MLSNEEASELIDTGRMQREIPNVPTEHFTNAELETLSKGQPLFCVWKGQYIMVAYRNGRFVGYEVEERKPEPLSAYNLLWHPETNPLLKQVHLKGKNSDGEDYEEDVTAIDAELVRQACAVHLYIKSHREELSKYNPSNGWGSYDNLLKCSGDFVKVLLDIPAEEYDNYFLYCWT